MKILVIQESDWGLKGPHQQHHLLERMQMKGHSIRIIDYDIFWRKKPKKHVISLRREYHAVGKVAKESELHVIRPPMIHLPILCYLSILVFHTIEIHRQVKEFKPDVIVGWGIINSFLASILARMAGIPFVFYVIDRLHSLIPEQPFQIMGRKIESWVVHTSNLILVINKGLAEYVVRLGAPSSRVRVLSAGIDPYRMNPEIDGSAIRESYGVSSDDTLLFFMGNMFPFSGIDKVAEELLQDSSASDIKMLLLGRGALFERLQEMSQHDRVGKRIVLVDWVQYDKVPQYIAAADFCLLPADVNDVMRDIVPIKTYEYLACGNPLIATKLPGIMKEFGLNNGVLYVDSARDVLPLVKHLKKTPALVQEIGEAAHNAVARFSWSIITKRFESMLGALAK